MDDRVTAVNVVRLGSEVSDHYAFILDIDLKKLPECG